MIYIMHIRLEGGRGHEHIARLRWRDPQTGQVDDSSTARIVDWIEHERGDARVRDAHGGREAAVGVVRFPGRTPFLRTHADGLWNDNLLALPTF